MMKHKLAFRVAGVIFFLVGVGHLLRFLFEIDVTVGGFVVPMGVSVFGCMVSLFLSLWVLKSIE